MSVRMRSREERDWEQTHGNEKGNWMPTEQKQLELFPHATKRTRTSKPDAPAKQLNKPPEYTSSSLRW